MPTKTRNVSGLAVRRQNSKSWYLIDCGEGTQHRLLHTNLSLKHLNAIMITHVHGDHCYGLPGLLATTAMSGRTEALTIIAPKGIKEMVTAVAKASDLFLPYDVNFIAVEYMESWTSAEFSVCKVALSHRVPSYAYVFTEKPLAHRLDVELLNKLGVPKGPLWGKLQQGQAVTLEDHTRVNPEDCYLKEGNPRKTIICGDNDNPELLKDFALDVSLIVHEATYTHDIAEKVGKGPQHSCAKIVAEFAERQGVPNVILTHFSARYQDDTEKSPSIAEIEQEALNFYSGQLYLANDLDVFRLLKNGIVEKSSNELF